MNRRVSVMVVCILNNKTQQQGMLQMALIKVQNLATTRVRGTRCRRDVSI